MFIFAKEEEEKKDKWTDAFDPESKKNVYIPTRNMYNRS